jgi:hypothetical protein
MIDYLINILIHPAFSAVTFFAGLLLGNHFAVHRDRRKEFNQAAREFRSTFGNYRRQIQDGEPGFDPETFFTTFYYADLKALDDFMSWLSRRKQIAIQKAWNKHCWNDERGKTYPNQIMFAHYIYLNNEVDKIDCRQLALDNIARILAFAVLR